MSGLKARKLRRERSAPKWGDVLAPLLDVIFLLVIFLLVTASFDDRQLIDVQLPQARGDSAVTAKELDAVLSYFEQYESTHEFKPQHRRYIPYGWGAG